MSKGDNNQVNDIGLYPKGIFWLKKKHIIGKIRAYCPYVGYLTILFSDYEYLKYALIGFMFLSVLVSKDPENK